MYPRTIVDADVKTESERKVFGLLRDQLPDEWEVFYSVSWIDRDPFEGARDGEIDFVLCRPDQPLVCLEVKGGGIECQHGAWYRTEPGGKRERIPDPFGQALDHRYDLERLLEKQPGWKRGKSLIAHALVFPFTSVHQLALAPDAPREILIDRREANDDLVAALDRALAYHRGARDKRALPGQDGVTAVRQLLAPQVQITVPMAAEFLDEEEALILLTHEQSMLLARMRRDPRMVIRGCAGSGKTMLAVEHGKRLATEGKRVLLVCFNRALRDHLWATTRQKGLTIQNFHALCRQLAREANLEVPRYPKDEAPQSFFNEELPDLLVDAIDKLGDRFDAILVDEAQDLSNDWLAALLCTLRDEENDPVWFFMDDNQRVYQPRLEVSREFRPFDLTVNCRNTQAIHREVMKQYEGDIVPEVKGPPGRAPEMYTTDDPAPTVAGAIARLHEREQVPLQDIVVLSSHGYDNCEVRRELPGRYLPTNKRGENGKHVYFSSIRGFKGLESPVVILCELEDLDDETLGQQLYVAVSRARNHVVVVAPETA